MVTTLEMLRDVIGCILDKARNETHFSSLYAEMCVKLSQVVLPVAIADKASVFRRLLLNKCGEMFDEGFARVARLSSADSPADSPADSGGPSEDPEDPTALLEAERQAKSMKKLVLGHIRYAVCFV